MTDKVEIKIEGAKELLAFMKRVPTRIRNKNLRRATRQSAALVRDDIRKNAPVRSGRLRRNIRSRGRRGGRTYTKAVVFVNVGPRGPQQREVSGRFMGDGSKSFRGNPKDAYYWRFLEYGTKNMPAQPFIRPTAERNLPRVVDHVITETDRGIREDIKKL